MAILFFPDLPFVTLKMCPIASKSVHVKYKVNMQTITKNCKNVATLAKFRQIWSHCASLFLFIHLNSFSRCLLFHLCSFLFIYKPPPLMFTMLTLFCLSSICSFQCDQIGRFLKGLGQKFSYKIA